MPTTLTLTILTYFIIYYQIIADAPFWFEYKNNVKIENTCHVIARYLEAHNSCVIARYLKEHMSCLMARHLKAI